MAGFLKRTFSGGDNLSVREDTKEAIAYFVVLMIYADGDVGDDEVRAAMGTLGRCGLFADNSNDDDFKLLQRMERKMNQDAEGNAERYAEFLRHSEWRYTAAAIMTEIMLSDGSIGSDEHHLLSHLCGKVAIDETELAAMVETIKAMRRSWIN